MEGDGDETVHQDNDQEQRQLAQEQQQEIQKLVQQKQQQQLAEHQQQQHIIQQQQFQQQQIAHWQQHQKEAITTSIQYEQAQKKQRVEYPPPLEQEQQSANDIYKRQQVVLEAQIEIPQQQQMPQPQPEQSKVRAVSGRAKKGRTKNTIKSRLTSPTEDDLRIPPSYVEVRVIPHYGKYERVVIGEAGMQMFDKIEDIGRRDGTKHIAQYLGTIIPLCLDEATALLVGTYHALESWLGEDEYRAQAISVIAHLDDCVARCLANHFQNVSEAKNTTAKSEKEPEKLSDYHALRQLDHMTVQINSKLNKSLMNKTMRASQVIKDPHLFTDLPRKKRPPPVHIKKQIAAMTSRMPDQGSIQPHAQWSQLRPQYGSFPTIQSARATTSIANNIIAGGNYPAQSPQVPLQIPPLVILPNGQEKGGLSKKPQTKQPRTKRPTTKKAGTKFEQDDKGQSHQQQQSSPQEVIREQPLAYVACMHGTLLESMVNEAAFWIGDKISQKPANMNTISEDAIRRLLYHIRLEDMESACIELDDNMCHEDLRILFSIPEKEGRKLYEWKVEWYDFEAPTNQVYPALVGRFCCKPFAEDPPFFNKLHRSSRKATDVAANHSERSKFSRQFMTAANTPRAGWQLKWIQGLKSKAEAWRKSAGLKTKDLDWDDVARAVCAGVGIMARDHPKNQGSWILKRTILRLQREFTHTMMIPSVLGGIGAKSQTKHVQSSTGKGGAPSTTNAQIGESTVLEIAQDSKDDHIVVNREISLIDISSPIDQPSTPLNTEDSIMIQQTEQIDDDEAIVSKSELYLEECEKLRRYRGGCSSNDAYFESLRNDTSWTRRHDRTEYYVVCAQQYLQQETQQRFLNATVAATGQQPSSTRIPTPGNKAPRNLIPPPTAREEYRAIGASASHFPLDLLPRIAQTQ
uniref:Uncharacterized protein n=1 Tax=Aureoumbra lagunensis TaxID=44058 RepID=A0A7S3K3L0_9STRA|mmetsp:Transcript_16376/g.24584  ORF Transcript_16376/g.24584 Transcript_16376/m.24584 type:complete len:914 (+) Transcript_16376:54-2795(+)